MVELYMGYQFAHLDRSMFDEDASNGWAVALQGNVSRSWSLVGEFSGVYNRTGSSDMDEYFLLFGPRYTKRMRKGNLFAHALFGGANGRRTFPTTPPLDSLAMSFGGGADLKLSRRFAWRVGQLDYTYSHQGDSGNHFRYSTGLVLNFGKR